MTTQEISIVPQEKIIEYEKQIAEFLPGAGVVPHPVRMAMAQIALMNGLDPFMRQVWPIPTKNKAGEIVGWTVMVGIAGWRANAHATNEYWGRRFEKCTDEERVWIGAGPDDIALHCFVLRRKTGSQPMEFDGYGLYRKGEYTKMNPLFCARLRAERDAMKAAFPIAGIGGDVPVGFADEETGDVIDGEVTSTSASKVEPTNNVETIDDYKAVCKAWGLTEEESAKALADADGGLVTALVFAESVYHLKRLAKNNKILHGDGEGIN